MRDDELMDYDYIIIGGGVAGSICAYDLCKKEYKCLVLEKYRPDHEKICGGGISYKALELIRQSGIEIAPLFKFDSQAISGHISYKDGRVSEKIYKDGKVSLGIQRHLFDDYLRNQAQIMGADIRFEHKVSKVLEEDDKYIVDGYSGNQLIWAIGARSLDGKIPKGQSIGLSGQIEARAYFNVNRFYYWYYEPACETKYFWAFPIGKNLWNVGLWSRQAFPEMRCDYEDCLERYFLSHLSGEWRYLRKPKAEFLGHLDQRKERKGCIGVGDFAGKCNPVNGGGIIGAIQSALITASKN